MSIPPTEPDRRYGPFRNFNWLSRKSTLNLKLQSKFACGKPMARFRQLHYLVPLTGGKTQLFDFAAAAEWEFRVF